MNRRNALATFIGGMFAGPQIAQQATKSFSGGLGIPNLGNPGSNAVEQFAKDKIPEAIEVTKEMASKGYLERKALVQKAADGEPYEWQKRQLEQARKQRHTNNIECLKSVSPSHKFEMAMDDQERRMRKEWKDQAQKELNEIEETWKNQLWYWFYRP